jgi:tetratricopeptide (TPR) repeat protein
MTARPASKKSQRKPSRPARGERRSSRRSALALAIVVVALAARVAVLFELGAHPLLQPRGVLDDAVYTELGRRVAAGDLAVGPDVYFMPPFYIYFLGLVFAVTDGSIAAARLVQVLLGAISVFLILRTATAWFGRRAGLWAGGLAAATGLFAFNEILILQSSLDPFLTALALFTLTRAVQASSPGRFAAAGMSLAALALNRPNALPAAAAVALTWVAARRSKAAFQQAIVLMLGWALLVAPVVLRNRAVAGEWALVTSHGGLNFYIGNGDRADGTWKVVPGVRPSIAGQTEDVQRVAGEALGRAVSASEASSYFYDRAWRWIRFHPGDWARLLLRKLVLTFNATDPALNYSFTYYARDESTLLSLLAIGPWVVVPLGLFGLVAATPREGRVSYVTWLVFLPVYALSLVAFFVSSRYRLPLLVPLLAGAGATVSWLASRVAAREWRRLAVGVLVLAALFGLANWPIEVDDGRLNEREERVVQLIDDGDVERGERLLADTESRHPDPALMLLRVGTIYLERGDLARAVQHLERALAHRPEPAIRLPLGEALLESGRPGGAAGHFEAARAAGLSGTRTAYGLVRAYQALGQNERAREALASVRISRELDGETLLDLGMAALELHDAELAETFLRESVARVPALAGAHEQLGIALGRQQKLPEAVAQLETAVRLDPTRSSARFFLALAYFQQGRPEDARVQAEQALRLKPDYPEAANLLSRLPPGR